MKFKIGYRTVKTALGTVLSMMIAQYFGFQNFASAGIITILCIQVTKKQSLKAAWSRFLACAIAIIFSVAFFEVLSYHPLVIGLMLLFFIPTAVKAGASEGIVSSSVIILHIYMNGRVTSGFLMEELGLITVGIGVALVMNLYMPSSEDRLETYRREIEENFRMILKEISKYLECGDSNWDGRELPETARLINEAKTLSFQDIENHFFRDDDLYYQYFKIREKQFDIIERVLPAVTSIPHQVEQAKMVAAFVETLSEGINPGNKVLYHLEKLMRMRKEFENMELPKSREEFEARAALLNFLNEMESFLLLKRSFKGLRSAGKLAKA
ncbi:aromatic acid exporter family protein [Bacillus massilinigeriensis]|uniref:aromatic acid exporter family protein n=1 Tax=Bacillus mediterraneensis TaxID=1805474 RepID=UPI0008F80EC2|nr:aromatic acid exporter family protein [Bacillus mediterraneensis]